jgi:hypothetical protein
VNQTPRVATVANLLARAIDPATPEPEAHTSAKLMVNVARKDSVNLIDLVRHFPLVCAADVPKPRRDPRPVEADIEMPFGKHEGMTLEEIGRRHPSYLRWLSENIEDEEISDGAAEVLDWLKRRGAAA